MATFVAVLKFAQLLFWSAVLIPPQFLILAFTKGKTAYVLPALWHRMVCRAFGLQIVTEGNIVHDTQTLYVGNHISYLDIPAISRVLPVSFVAKADVAQWPLFGLCAKLQQTAFISRARLDSKQESDHLKNRLQSGSSLIIFPEGTSSDGSGVLPFKSSLFAMIVDPELSQRLVLQPFTIELVEIDGRPAVTQQDRDLYAWYGDMTLMPHFWQFAKIRGAKVKLHFHAPIHVKDGETRKNLAAACHKEVAGALNPALHAAA